MNMKPKLQVLDHDIAADIRGGIEYICITDIAKYKIEFLGIWEQLNNPDFKPVS